MVPKGFAAAAATSTGDILCSLILWFVISPSGMPCRLEGSGDAEGLGVGNEGVNSGVASLMDLRGATLLRFRGEAFLVGDSGSTTVATDATDATDSSGSRILLASAATLFLARLARGAEAVAVDVFLLPVVDLRGLFAGTGVNSSSLSSLIAGASAISSSSSESMMAARWLAAARLDGRVDMVLCLSFQFNKFVFCIKLQVSSVKSQSEKKADVQG